MKRWIFLAVLLVVCLSCAAASAQLVGSRTNAGELDEHGHITLYGCNEHGELTANGWDNVAQLEMQTHTAIVLTTDGTVHLFGMHGFDEEAVGSWTDVKQLLWQGSYLLGLKENGTVEAAYTLAAQADPYFEPDEWVEVLQKRADVERLLGDGALLANGGLLTDVRVFNEEDEGFLDEGRRILNEEDGLQWSMFTDVQLDHQTGYVLALTPEHRLFMLKHGEKGQVLRDDVVRFFVSESMVTVHTLDSELKFFTLNQADASWRNVRYPERSHTKQYVYWDKIDTLCYADANYAAAVRWDKLITDGNLFEVNSTDCAPGEYLGNIAQCELYRDRLIIRYHDSWPTYEVKETPLVVLWLDGVSYYLSVFGDDTIFDENPLIAGGIDQERQIELRDLSGRVSYPYAVKDDGTVIDLSDGKADKEVLAWENVRCISHYDYGDSRWTAACTSSGQVLVFCRTDKAEVLANAQKATQWQNVAYVQIYRDCIAAVTTDGQVLAAGGFANQPDVDRWNHAVSVAITGGIYSGHYHTESNLYALSENGTIYGDFSGEKGVLQISGCSKNLYGLKQDGSVFTTGYNGNGECDTANIYQVTYLAAPGDFYDGCAFVGCDKRIYQWRMQPSYQIENLMFIDDVKACYYSPDDGWIVLAEDGLLYASTVWDRKNDDYQFTFWDLN